MPSKKEPPIPRYLTHTYLSKSRDASAHRKKRFLQAHEGELRTEYIGNLRESRYQSDLGPSLKANAPPAAFRPPGRSTIYRQPGFGPAARVREASRKKVRDGVSPIFETPPEVLLTNRVTAARKNRILVRSRTEQRIGNLEQRRPIEDIENEEDVAFAKNAIRAQIFGEDLQGIFGGGGGGGGARNTTTNRSVSTSRAARKDKLLSDIAEEDQDEVWSNVLANSSTRGNYGRSRSISVFARNPNNQSSSSSVEEEDPSCDEDILQMSASFRGRRGVVTGMPGAGGAARNTSGGRRRERNLSLIKRNNSTSLAAAPARRNHKSPPKGADGGRFRTPTPGPPSQLTRQSAGTARLPGRTLSTPSLSRQGTAGNDHTMLTDDLPSPTRFVNDYRSSRPASSVTRGRSAGGSPNTLHRSVASSAAVIPLGGSARTLPKYQQSLSRQQSEHQLFADSSLPPSKSTLFTPRGSFHNHNTSNNGFNSTLQSGLQSQSASKRSVLFRDESRATNHTTARNRSNSPGMLNTRASHLMSTSPGGRSSTVDNITSASNAKRQNAIDSLARRVEELEQNTFENSSERQRADWNMQNGVPTLPRFSKNWSNYHANNGTSTSLKHRDPPHPSSVAYYRTRQLYNDRNNMNVAQVAVAEEEQEEFLSRNDDLFATSPQRGSNLRNSSSRSGHRGRQNIHSTGGGGDNYSIAATAAQNSSAAVAPTRGEIKPDEEIQKIMKSRGYTVAADFARGNLGEDPRNLNADIEQQLQLCQQQVRECTNRYLETRMQIKRDEEKKRQDDFKRTLTGGLKYATEARLVGAFAGPSSASSLFNPAAVSNTVSIASRSRSASPDKAGAYRRGAATGAELFSTPGNLLNDVPLVGVNSTGIKLNQKTFWAGIDPNRFANGSQQARSLSEPKLRTVNAPGLTAYKDDFDLDTLLNRSLQPNHGGPLRNSVKEKPLGAYSTFSGTGGGMNKTGTTPSTASRIPKENPTTWDEKQDALLFRERSLRNLYLGDQYLEKLQAKMQQNDPDSVLTAAAFNPRQHQKTMHQRQLEHHKQLSAGLEKIWSPHKQAFRDYDPQAERDHDRNSSRTPPPLSSKRSSHQTAVEQMNADHALSLNVASSTALRSKDLFGGAQSRDEARAVPDYPAVPSGGRGFYNNSSARSPSSTGPPGAGLRALKIPADILFQGVTPPTALKRDVVVSPLRLPRRGETRSSGTTAAQQNQNAYDFLQLESRSKASIEDALNVNQSGIQFLEQLGRQKPTDPVLDVLREEPGAGTVTTRSALALSRTPGRGQGGGAATVSSFYSPSKLTEIEHLLNTATSKKSVSIASPSPDHYGVMRTNVKIETNSDAAAVLSSTSPWNKESSLGVEFATRDKLDSIEKSALSAIQEKQPTFAYYKELERKERVLTTLGHRGTTSEVELDASGRAIATSGVIMGNMDEKAEAQEIIRSSNSSSGSASSSASGGASAIWTKINRNSDVEVQKSSASGSSSAESVKPDHGRNAAFPVLGSERRTPPVVPLLGPPSTSSIGAPATPTTADVLPGASIAIGGVPQQHQAQRTAEVEATTSGAATSVVDPSPVPLRAPSPFLAKLQEERLKRHEWKKAQLENLRASF
ncbi:unnamed protein product [Amoebophrya sp. A120]|nr:unnamed protein product [Amoebophrya sp. A120]|eukprot:GSA120T00009630001.1